MKKILFTFTLISILFLCGCSKKNKAQQITQDTIEISVSNSTSQIPQNPQTWHITNKRLCVIFGYDFNAPEVSKPIIQQLAQKYGLAENNGLIMALTYPDDFKHGVKGYSSDLYTILNDDDTDFAGVVILGAPEKTHTALARLQDKWDQQVPYPIIALFPQDDVLGLESACDVVIDQGQSSDINLEDQEQTLPDADKILFETINYIMALGAPLSRDISVQTHVQQMYPDRSIRRYVDPESGLQSINHFVFK